GLPVRTVMNTWIYQGGSPLVRLDAGTLTQSHFAYGERADVTEIGEAWHTPVIVRSLDGGEERHLLEDRPVAVSLPGPIVVNAGASGYYRVGYDSASIASLSSRLGELTPPERVSLVGDTWGLVYASKAPWSQFDAVVNGLAGIDEPFIWGGFAAGGGLVGGSVSAAAAWMHRALTDEQRPRLAGWVRTHFGPIFERLGWEPRDGEDDLARQMRGIVVMALGGLGQDEAVRAEAIRRFEAGEYAGDLAGAVLRVVAANGDPAHYRLMLERFHTAPTPQDEQRYLYNLAGFDVEEVVTDLLPRCLNGEIRSQDAPGVLLFQMALPDCGPTAWRYFTSRWDEALSIFPAYLHPRLTWGVATYITDPGFADEVESFHRSHEITGQQKQVDQQIELMRVGLAFTRAIRPQF
ncbi:MAG TPA: ERAP1-like C-terminal domain-containing protein, partial [Acidimicrobiales bacterium]|nr:ERAP1-like C-terminal domain-containing protein [Acidimicrobiales bacterium]